MYFIIMRHENLSHKFYKEEGNINLAMLSAKLA